jgi:hypothetical protein
VPVANRGIGPVRGRRLIPALLTLSLLTVAVPLGIVTEVAAATPDDAATAWAEDLTTPEAVAGLHIVPGVALQGVSCFSKTQCLAVGDVGGLSGSPGTEGVYLTITDGVPGPVQTVAGTFALTSVDCVSATTCDAVGTDPFNQPPEGSSTGGVIVVFENGTAVNGYTIAPPGFGPGVLGSLSLNGIGCSDTTTCMAVGYSDVIGGFAVNIGTRGPGGVLFPTSLYSANGIECVQGDWCKINAENAGPSERGNGGLVVAFKIGLDKRVRVGSAAGAVGTLQGGDCHQEDFEFCLVAGSTYGSGFVFDDIGSSSGRVIPVPGTSSLDDVSCAGAYWCLAAGQGSSGVGVLVPVGWETPTSAVPVTGTSEFSGVSCVSSGICVAVGAAPGGAAVDSFRVWSGH